MSPKDVSPKRELKDPLNNRIFRESFFFEPRVFVLFGDVSGKIALRARLHPPRRIAVVLTMCSFRRVRLYHPYRFVETKNSVPRRTTEVIRPDGKLRNIAYARYFN